MEHTVPRTRYGTKVIRNESSKGCDLIGFKLFDGTESPQDILTIFEVKAQFSGDNAGPRLQDAVDGSAKDEVRKAESLNAIKQRLMDKQQTQEATQIGRFQNPADKPYRERYGAAAFFSSEILNEQSITETVTSNHPKEEDLILVVVSAEDCMQMVHKLYEIAANEA